MTNLSTVEKIFQDFLKNQKPQIIALKWDWGSGKTFFWNHFLHSRTLSETDTYKNHSYCSLFWENNLEEIKKKILYNSKSLHWKQNLFQKILPKKWFQTTTQVGWDIITELDWMKTGKVPKIINDSFLFFTFPIIKNHIICLDDFERIGNIEIHKLLWFISELKEEHKCKIILIFNHNELSEEIQEIYSKFREKIIDIEIEFNPTPEECGKIIFQNHENKDHFEYILYNQSTQLWIKNIRILQKIKDFWELWNEELKNIDEIIHNEILSTIPLLVYSYYGNPHNNTNSKIPSINFISSYNSIDFFSEEWKENLKPYEENWKNILHSLWWHTTEIDQLIIKTIERWYLQLTNEENNIIQERITSLHKGDIQRKYNNIWRDIFHGGFEDNEEVFILTMKTIFQNYWEYLTGQELNSTVEIFKKLWRSWDETTSIIDDFIRKNSNNVEKFNIEEVFHFQSPENEIKTKFNEIYNTTIWFQKGTLKELLDYMIQWWETHIDIRHQNFINQITENEIYELFKNNSWPQLYQYRKILTRNYHWIDWKNTDITLEQKTQNALTRFNTCNINKIRLQAYGILNDE